MSVMDQFSVVAFPWGKEIITVERLADVARHAEGLNFHSVNLPMVNVSLPDDDLFATFEHNHILEPVVVMTAMIMATSHIRICSDAFPLPLLPPYHWAKTIAVMDQLSGGRIIAGMCPGYGKAQFEVYGASLKGRGRLCDEQLEIITRLWTEDAVSYEGERYSLSAMTCEPKPVQKPYPPIWWAGAKASIPRAARYAECFDPFVPTFDELRHVYAPALAAECEKWGTKTRLGAWIYCYITPDGELSGEAVNSHFAGTYFSGRPELPQSVAMAGSPAQCAAKIREYQDAGLSQFILDFQQHGVKSTADSMAQMTLFRELVVPLL